jgi:hypothetical protein
MPAALSTVTTNQVYSVAFQRREFAARVSGDPDLAFSMDQPLNPSNSNLFPWLSKIAPQFDMFLFRRCSVIYIPSCATTTPGSLTMAFDYDPTDINAQKVPESLGVMPGATTGQVYTRSVLEFNPNSCPTNTHKFYTSASDDHGEQERFTHPARFLLCMSARPTAKTDYGSLYVDYDVLMISPQDAGPGYSNDAKVTVNTLDGNADDPLGSLANQTLKTNKPTTEQVVAKTNRVTRVINGVVTLVGQVAPFFGALAKAILVEYMPALPGTAMIGGVVVKFSVSQIPGDVVYVMNSSQARKATILACFYGIAHALPAVHALPQIIMAASDNVTVNTVSTTPGSDVQSLFSTIGQDYTVKLTGQWEVSFADPTETSAWIKPVVMWDNGQPLVWEPQSGVAELNWMEVFVKTDL